MVREVVGGQGRWRAVTVRRACIIFLHVPVAVQFALKFSLFLSFDTIAIRAG
jgi:hypothetical protein